MRQITLQQFAGTTTELQARVDAFRGKLADHAKTVGVPAPREEDWIEDLVRSGEPFEVVVPKEPEPRTVDQMRASARARIGFEREMAIARGIVAVGGKDYQTSPEGMAALTATIAALQAGAKLPAGFTWRAADNTDTPIGGLTDLEPIASAALAARWQAHQKARALKQQIDALPADATQADFDAVKW